MEKHNGNITTTRRLQREVRDLLRKCGAIVKRGHFKIANGNHSYTYVHIRRALADEQCAKKLAMYMLNAVEQKSWSPSVIACWTIGGRFLADDMAEILRRRGDGQVSVVFLERKGSDFVGLDKIHGNESVILVDDILTTGYTLKRIADQLRDRFPGALQLVAVVAQMGDRVPDFGVRFLALTELPIPNWPESQCRKCRQGIPLVDLSEANVNPFPVLRDLAQEDSKFVLRELVRVKDEEDLRNSELHDRIETAASPVESLEAIIAGAEDLGMPDLAAQHDHYLYGTPKR